MRSLEREKESTTLGDVYTTVKRICMRQLRTFKKIGATLIQTSCSTCADFTEYIHRDNAFIITMYALL